MYDVWSTSTSTSLRHTYLISIRCSMIRKEKGTVHRESFFEVGKKISGGDAFDAALVRGHEAARVVARRLPVPCAIVLQELL